MSGFPGGTALSRVRVYDWPTANGEWGGSPHLHTTSTEGYVVVAGHGHLETLSGSGYGEHRLEPGTVLWFTPGTVHRLVNTGGDLELLVLMSNAGLPEAGDAVLTFPPQVLDDPRAYAEAASLPKTNDETALAAAARKRRDLAVEGYLTLREEVRQEGPAALVGLWQAAAALVRDRTAVWRELWRDGPLADAVSTGDYLDYLADGESTHLVSSDVYGATTTPQRFGMCGHLTSWDLARV